MVVEKFKAGNAVAIDERFQKTGRMLPDGVIYLQSWVDAPGTCCFQLMEADDQDALTPWLKHWGDLVEFSIFPVLSSTEFWATYRSLSSTPSCSSSHFLRGIPLP